jgi:hypothetical protein
LPAKAGRKSGDDPIMRMLRNTLLNSKGKYDGSKAKAIMILAEITRIGTCLAEVSPAYAAAWNGRPDEVHNRYKPDHTGA